jgi:hypothetical protein
MSDETLIDLVNRAKARWLKRAMYGSSATSTQKVLAYAISDHLNCVTLDCWPAQSTLTGLLGRRSDKTAQRAARGLRALKFITISRGTTETSGYRYAPVFVPSDWDKIGSSTRQKRAELGDTNVHQSNLGIQLKSSSTASGKANGGIRTSPTFNPAARGAIELKLAQMLGPNGMDALGRLAGFDDTIVDRLCRSFSEGLIGERELIAARLAAEQVR